LILCAILRIPHSISTFSRPLRLNLLNRPFCFSSPKTASTSANLLFLSFSSISLVSFLKAIPRKRTNSGPILSVRPWFDFGLQISLATQPLHSLQRYSRFKLMAYSDQKSWTNGLTFFLWVLSWLRSHGVSVPIVFTVDRGEEFGGKSWLKLIELRKLLSGFGCSIIQNHAASPQENAHVERSHRTDDEEFYIPRLLSIHSQKDFFLEAMHYLYYYNAVRKHSSLQRRSPWEHLVANSPDLDAKIRFVPPILLDNIAVQLGDWSGYHLLAQYQKDRRKYKIFFIYYHCFLLYLILMFK